MYEQYFGFSRKPFDRNIPPSALYETPEHQELQSRLEYVAQNRLFCVVTGDCGTGKTTAMRKFVASLNPGRYRCVYIIDSALTPRVFYWVANKELSGIEKPTFYRSEGKKFMIDTMSVMMDEGSVIPVVIIDEAHLLSREMLEETRFLLNYKLDSQNPMSLIVVGQSELRGTLSRSTYEPICQRIDFRFRLTPFDRSQTAEYIDRHLQYAGLAQNQIFSESAINRIYDHSVGIARIINKVCDLSLIHAFQQHNQVIDEPIISRVIEKELQW